MDETDNCESVKKTGIMKQTINDWKLFFIMEGIVCLFLGVFYISCGQALYSRESGGCITPFAASGDTGELTQGRVVEQIYTSWMDRMDAIGVRVTDYGHPLTSELYVQCEDLTAGQLMMQKTFQAQEIGTDQYLYLEPPEGIRLQRGHKIRVSCTSNGTPGDAPAVLYHAQYQPPKEQIRREAQLVVDQKPAEGMMCLVVVGTDFVWTGPHYWQLVLLAVMLTAVLYAAEVGRRRKGKWSVLFGTMDVLNKYGFLIRQLVQRDFKVRYKRSVLGVFWSFLNPLLLMVVQYLVFSQLFQSDIDNYPVYLLSGVVVFNFFSEGVGQALGSIVGNAALITKVYLPKYIYPVTRVLLSGINLLMSLIPLVLAALLTGEEMTKAYLMLPYILACVMVFTVGLGMALAAGMTFFRDVQFLWGVVSMLWMYLTPLFYPVSILPDQFRPVVTANPMYFFVSAVRSIVMEAVTPRPMVFLQCTTAAILMLAAGCLIFKKTQDRFIFYI